MTGKPNLLFIYTDEQRYDTLAAYGNRTTRMPNLNRLAGESIVVENAYVTQPVCTPSRSSILTGLYPHTNGCVRNNAPLPAEARCLPELLDGTGYISAHFGKWHLGDEIFPQHGFSCWRSTEDGYRNHYSSGRDPGARSSYHEFLVENGFKPHGDGAFSRLACARLPEKYGKPAYLAGEASRFIRENRGRPFILYVNFLEPHMPFTGPRDGDYDPESITLPANFDDIPGPRSHLKTRLFQRIYTELGFGGNQLQTEADWRRLAANYLGLCSLVDTHAGAIIDTLDECGLRGNTIVVFTSDHGDMMGSHRLLAKCVMYEEAVRVPLLIRLPGAKRGGKLRGNMSQVDLVPTLLDLMGSRIPPELQGESRRAVLEGKAPARLEDDVFIEWNGDDGRFSREKYDSLPESIKELGSPEELYDSVSDPVRTVITSGGWKLNYSARGEHELYNLREDPRERINLYGAQNPGGIERELKDKISRWQERTADAPRT